MLIRVQAILNANWRHSLTLKHDTYYWQFTRRGEGPSHAVRVELRAQAPGSSRAAAAALSARRFEPLSPRHGIFAQGYAYARASKLGTYVDRPFLSIRKYKNKLSSKREAIKL